MFCLFCILINPFTALVEEFIVDIIAAISLLLSSSSLIEAVVAVSWDVALRPIFPLVGSATRIELVKV